MTDAPRTPHPPSNAGGQDSREQLDRFFDWIRSSGITRGGDRWLAGVCGGIARRTGLDPMIVRGAVIVLAILGGPVLIAYALGWAFLPNAAGRIHAEQLFRGVFEPAMVAILALVVFTFVPFTRGLWWQGPPVGWGMPDWLATTLAGGWAIAVTIGIIWLVVFLLRRIPANGYGPTWSGRGPAAQTGNTGTTNPPGSASFAATETGSTTTRATGSTTTGVTDAAGMDATATGTGRNRWEHHHPGAGFTAIVLGIALAAGAVAAGVYAAGTWSSAALLVGVAFELGMLALGIIVSGIRGRNSGAMGGFAFLAVLTLLFVGVFPQGTQFSPFGDNRWEVTSSTADTTPSFAMIAGNPTVDLSDLSTAGRAGERTTDVWLGFGATDVILPADRSVRVETNSIIGGVNYGDDRSSDRGGILFHDSRSLNGNPGRPVAAIRIWSLVGQVDVHTATE